MSENRNVDGSVQVITPNFTKEQFCMNDDAFDWLYSLKDQPDQFTRMSIWLENYASSKLKIGKKEYNVLKNMYLQKTNQGEEDLRNVTTFPDQPMELLCGIYTADHSGVSYINDNGHPVSVISHPIMPVKRFVNIDTGTEMIEIWFNRGEGWKKVLVQKEIAFSANKVVALSNDGVAVTSENAKELVKYLCFMECENFNKLPVQHSTSRLGWVKERFIPYDGDLVFDTSTGQFSELFDSVQAKGDFDLWKNTIKQRRTTDPINLPFRTMMAASFASPLIEQFKSLTFWVQLTGASGSGKTVSLICAASVWGDPVLGRYTQTLDTTKAGLEYLAGFLNSLPVCLDERQTVEDTKRTNLSEFVYAFCNKTGRNRALKTGGLQKKQNWQNVALSTGEQGITGFASKAGNQLRIIDIKFHPGDKMFTSVSEVNSFMRVIENNYGFAGREFIRRFQEEDIDKLNDRLDYLRKELEKSAAGRQVNFGALLILADELAEKYIFRDGVVLSIAEVSEFLKSDADVDMNVRTYQVLTDWLVSNRAKFVTDESDVSIPSPLLGKVKGDSYFVLKTEFEKFFQTYNFDDVLFKEWAMDKGIIISHKSEKDRHHDAQIKISGQKHRAWEIKIGVLDQQDETKDSDRPEETSVPAGYTQTHMDDDELPW